MLNLFDISVSLEGFIYQFEWGECELCLLLFFSVLKKTPYYWPRRVAQLAATRKIAVSLPACICWELQKVIVRGREFVYGSIGARHGAFPGLGFPLQR